MKNRKELLTKLVNYEKSLESIIERLTEYNWDCENPLVELKREHIIKIIQKYLNNEISKRILIEWANAVEMRDDIEYENGYEKLIATVLAELSAPEINNPLKREYLVDIIANLLLR